jgi:hypothetical protein
MPEFRFKRIETIVREITVHADSYEQANARASVGGIEHIRRKEGVEITSYDECTETVNLYGPEQIRVDAYKEFDDPAERDVFMGECRGVDPNTIFFRIKGRFRVLAYVPRGFADRFGMVTT